MSIVVLPSASAQLESSTGSQEAYTTTVNPRSDGGNLDVVFILVI